MIVVSIFFTLDEIGSYYFSNFTLVIGICMILAGMLTGVIMVMTFAFVSSFSPEKKDMLIKEVDNLKAEIAVLRSERWLDMVKASLGEKFDRITSQQFLLDERNTLIHRRRRTIEAIEAMLE